MSSRSIQDCKKELSQDYLGKLGIHGIGVRTSEKAIYIYISKPHSAEQQKLLRKIEKQASPFKVITVREERPKIP
jgi:hypothetical protein